MDANYNLSGLISRVKTRLNDAEYSDDTIKEFINDAYLDILGDAEYQFLERIVRQYADNSSFMMLPPNFQTVICLTAKINGNVTPLHYIPKGEYFSTDRESGVNNYAYTSFANQILFSLPDISENNTDDYYEMTLYYLARPCLLVNDTDVPVIPPEFSEVIVLGALARAERRRDNFDYAAVYENKCDDLITNMKLRYCPRQLQGENRAKLPVVQRLRH